MRGRSCSTLRETKARLTSARSRGVGRRLEGEQREFLGLVEGGDMRLGRRHAELFAAHQVQDLAAEALVAEEGAHVLEAGEAPVIVIVPEEGRRGGVHGVVEGVGVAVEGQFARLGAGVAVGEGEGGGVGQRRTCVARLRRC